MEIEPIKFIFNSISGQISRTDTKANILLGVQLAIVGYFLSNLERISLNNYYFLIVFILFIIMVLMTLIFVFKVIWPSLNLKYLSKKGYSLIYFKSIHDEVTKDEKKTIHRFDKAKEEEFKEDLILQVLSLSEIATKKFIRIQKAFIFLGIEIFLGLIFLIPNFLNLETILKIFIKEG